MDNIWVGDSISTEQHGLLGSTELKRWQLKCQVKVITCGRAKV